MTSTSDTYQADPAEPQQMPTWSSDGAAVHGSNPAKTTPDALSQILGHPRTATTTAEIDTAITHPGSVRINVKGAFIVDQGTGTTTPLNGNGTSSNGTSSNGTSSNGTPTNGTPTNGTPTNGQNSPTQTTSQGHEHNGHQTKDIRLPNHTAVVSHVAIDIGGSLAKLVYFSREAHSTEPGGRLNFLSFETDHIRDCIEFMKQIKDKQQKLNGSRPGELCVMATGGGAYKYHDMIRAELGVDVLREDEMECLIIGLDFFITEIPREVFTYSDTDPMHFVEPSDDIYPYLLVNIGSGVSFLKVSGPRKYERVGGTSLGGGTLWGLLSLLTGARSFDEMLAAASRGDNTKVDMLVGDIYGTDYGKVGLKSTTIASSFGKVFRMKREAESEAEDSGGLDQKDQHRLHHFISDSTDVLPSTEPSENDHSHPPGPSRFTSADISRSLLYAISNNIGQIAFLQSQIHNLSHIYFGGSFIRGHPQTMNTLSYAIKFWSKGGTQAYFLRHEGYLGAVGAFLKRQPRNWGRRGSFEEELGRWQAKEARRAEEEEEARRNGEEEERGRDDEVVVV